MKKLIFVVFLLFSWLIGGAQDHSDYVDNFKLPGTTGENFNFGPLDDSIAVVRAEGWKVLVVGYYNLIHYTEAKEYKAIIERFEALDSTIVISFFKKEGSFDYDIKVSSGDGGIDELIASQIHNYLYTSQTGYDGQLIINKIAESLSFAKRSFLNFGIAEACSIGRSSQSIINGSKITSADAYFISCSGVPILIPAGSKVNFSTCTLAPKSAPDESYYQKGGLYSFTINNQLYTPIATFVDGHYIFGGYKTGLEGESYPPTSVFQNGGSVYLGFERECELIQMQEFKHINAIVSIYPNKHGGEFVDVRNLYPNFPEYYKEILNANGGIENVIITKVVSEETILLDCPPQKVVDIIKLNKAINGATYIECLNEGRLVIYNTEIGTIAAYDIIGQAEPNYMMFDNVRWEWKYITVEKGAFVQDLRKLVDGAAEISAKLAIFSAGFVASGGTAVLVDIAAAGAMYAIDGDKEAMAMDLLFAPLGVAVEAVTMYRDASKVADAMKDVSKISDVTSATYKQYKQLKGIKSLSNLMILGKDGKYFKWSDLKDELIAELGERYAKFCDDFIAIAQKSNKHLDLISCDLPSGGRGDGAGSRSGKCNRRLVKAWDDWFNFPNLRKRVDVLENYYPKRSKVLLDVEETFPGCHSKARHGTQLTSNDLQLRAKGEHPTLPKAKTSTKFDSEQLHDDAVNAAFNQHKVEIEAHFAGGGQYKEWDIDFGIQVGSGYHNSGPYGSGAILNEVTTKKVKITFDKDPLNPTGYKMIVHILGINLK